MPDTKPAAIENFVFMEPIVLAYGHGLFEPRTNPTFNSTYYSAMLLIPEKHGQRAALAELLKKLRDTALGGKAQHYPVESADAFIEKMLSWAAGANKERNYDWVKGYSVLNVRATLDYPPRLAVYRNNDWYVPEQGERHLVQSAFYGGARVVADLSICAYKLQGGTITAYVNDIRSLNKGDRIEGLGNGKEGRFGSASAFAKYVGTVSDHNPTAGLDAAEYDDDAIPL